MLNAAITAVTPVIQSLVDTFLKPKLEAFRDKKQSVPNNSVFIEYYCRTFSRLTVMNTLVSRKSQLLLDDIYIPLSIINVNSETKDTFKIDRFPTELSNKFRNILITDTAGMGKSTIMKKLFFSTILDKKGVPLFIELRRLNNGHGLLDEIQAQLSPLEKDFDKQLLLELLTKGDFIIILDGYDEIPLADKKMVTADIQGFIFKAPKNKFFLTSRPEEALSGFGNFQEFRIKPLCQEEAFELLRKYDTQGDISFLLINKLQDEGMKNIEEFLTNPLLVSLLFISFAYKQTIPLKKHLFYRQVFDANFESHDLTKGDSFIHDKHSNLSIDDFHRVLRFIGFNCFKQRKIEFSKDEIVNLIEKSKDFCAGLSFKGSDFLHDLLKTVPLFTKDGVYYRWAHKSLHEYFAAQFIYMDAKNKQNEILLSIYNSPRVKEHINVLDLYYDMDYKTFRNVIEYDLLKQYIKYCSDHYNEQYEGVSLEDVAKRKQVMFVCSSCYLIHGIPKGLPANKRHTYLNDLIPLKEGGNRHTLHMHPSNFHVITDFDKTKMKILSIIELLHSKQNEIILDGDLEHLNNIIEGMKSFMAANIPYEITDFKDTLLNKSDNFKNVSTIISESISFMIGRQGRGRIALMVNHDMAVKKYKAIQMNIELESNDDLFSF